MLGYFFLVPCLNALPWLAVIFGAVFFFFKRKFSYWKQRKVPYLEPSIPFGNMTKIFTGHREEELVAEGYETARSRGSKYCGAYMGVAPTLIIADVDLVKRILTTDHDVFPGRGIYVNEVDDPLGYNMFCLSGTKWRHLRNKLSPAFTSAKLKSMCQLVADCGASVERYVEENLHRGSLDVKNMMRSYTTNVIASCIFGLECDSFKQPDSFKKFATGKVFTGTPFSNFRWLFLDNFPKLSRTLRIRLHSKETENFFNRMVEETVSYREKNNYTRNDLMQTLINMKNGESKDFSMKEIVAQAFLFFTAGADTTSTTLTFALSEIAARPDIQERLRKEIQEVLAKHDDRVTYESLQELKYMTQFLKEISRLYPITRLFRRQCFKDYTIPGEDVTIEKGTIVLLAIHGIHHDSEYWAEPMKFDPERFSEDERNWSGYYMPFGNGPRICIGERMAWMTLKIALISVLKRYRISLPFLQDKIPSIKEDFFVRFNKI